MVKMKQLNERTVIVDTDDNIIFVKFNPNDLKRLETAFKTGSIEKFYAENTELFKGYRDNEDFRKLIEHPFKGNIPK